jgi:hypothetical protein
MSRNTARFSAFSTIILARICVALLLIAVASFYYLALWLASCAIAALAIFGGSRIVRDTSLKLRRHLGRKGLRRDCHEPHKKSDYFHQQRGGAGTQAKAAMPADAQVIARANGLLPGIPPICLN